MKTIATIKRFKPTGQHTLKRGLLLLAWLSTSLQALENMRPEVGLKATPSGVEVTLDFSNIPNEYWSELLAKPESFYEAGYGLAGKAGDPALPLITEFIPIDGITDPTFTIVTSSNNVLSSNALIKTPLGHLETDAPTIIQEYDWSASPSESTDPIKLGEPISMRGQLFLPMTVNPLKLDRLNREVRVPVKLVIQISGIRLGDPDELDETGAIRSVIPETEIYDRLGHYLIITPPLFEPYLPYLVEWKQRKGHPVTVVSTSVTGNTPTAIKAYIQEAYDTWEDPPRYVLLIGDEDRGIGGFYVYNPDDEALVTDHPYVLLEGDDSFPEAWVGRLSVDTGSEFATVISKILNYESMPALEDPGWFKRGLLVCTVTAAASTQHINNWIGRKLTENGFTEVDTAYYPMQSSLSFISNPINDGVGFVNYRGLGAWDHWIGPYFYNTDINALHNGLKLPIITSIVCGGGNFAAPVDPVFGEKWLRAGTSSVPKGAVAFIGPSEVHTHTQFNNVIDIGLYSAIFDLGINELGPALWHGKQDLWRNYYQSEYLPFGQSAEFYLNVYNILGDPGMSIWTDTPKMLVADYPEALDMSDDHIDIFVHDETGIAIPDAFVFILNAENARGFKTDASGSVSLAFNPGLETSLKLTITGKNLNPVLVTIPVEATLDDVRYSNWEIGSGGLLAAGQTQGINLGLSNHGASISALTLTLSSPSQNCTIIDSLFVLDNFLTQSSLELENIFSFEIDANARHGDVVDFLLSADSGTESWNWQHSFPVQAPHLMISSLDFLGSELLAGDSIAFGLTIENQGGLACPPLSLTFLDNALVWNGGLSLNCPAIGIDVSISTQTEGILFLSNQIYPGEVIELVFLAESGSRTDTLSTSLTIEQISRFSPSQPDAYGYRIFDDMDVSFSLAPLYEWIEIDPDLGGSGTRLSINDLYEEADDIVQLDLPFPITYYGQVYNAVTICSNGWLALGYTSEVSFYNRVIPSATGPNAMIAPFWDDLITNPGGVSINTIDDQFIVEWSRMSNLEVLSTLNFQVIIYNTDSYPTTSGDAQIKMQFEDYHNFDTWTNFSTTGIESPDYSTGLQAGFNNRADSSIGQLHSEQALLFTTERALRYPASEMSLSSTNLDFVMNPWTQAADSITISNNGGSALVYSLEPLDNVAREPAPNPLANFEFIKGGPEPDGRNYRSNTRDLFDYEWLDQDDPGGPEYDWIDISQPANRRDFTGDPDDSSIGPFQLGFEFPFYTEIYSQFYFSSNGTMSFVSDEYPWNNLTLPNGSAPAALLAPWWDDLNNNDGVQGVPYFWTNSADLSVITWDNFPKFGTDNRHTFQVILHGNGDILYQYKRMEGISSSSTVGLQDVSKSKGLQITYNAWNSINDNSAILIHRQLSWLGVNSWSGLVPAGETGQFRVSVDTRGQEQGLFSLPLMLRSNSANLPETSISINLNVINGITPPGDVNSDYQVNILDLSALIDFVLQLDVPNTAQFNSSDLAQDGQLDVLDMVVLIELLFSDAGA